jgi:hypothetical protein
LTAEELDKIPESPSGKWQRFKSFFSKDKEEQHPYLQAEPTVKQKRELI